MERVTGGAELPQRYRGGVAALGNFDGFHAGHQAVVGRARDLARARGVPALVVSFDPHPARLFRADSAPFALTRIDQRLDLFEAFGIDAGVMLPFTRELAALTAPEFVAEWLVRRLGVSGVVTGDDFTFGKGRSGTVGELAALGAAQGFTAEVVAPVADAFGTISSTRIRALLGSGNPAAATELLTRPYTIRAEVEHGAKLGRQLGFPTANQRLGDYLRPAYGVYAVLARLPDGSVVKGVANLGIRPMLTPPVELLETWLLDWSGDLYGATLDVALIAYLRPEMALPDLDALKVQVMADAAAARVALL
ncbi:riboflavin biosynthesis protein RibF [alpha proteobacterium AAP81b]|nr:riboflavin biosynthesis protein RibF [alpha proteobacterium AAP81b]